MNQHRMFSLGLQLEDLVVGNRTRQFMDDEDATVIWDAARVLQRLGRKCLCSNGYICAAHKDMGQIAED